MTHHQRRAVRQRLEDLLAAGVRQLPRAAARSSQPTTPSGGKTEARPADTPPPEASKPREPVGGADDSRARPPQAVVGSAMAGTPVDAPTLEALDGLVRGCTRCPELACTRTQTVFGVGSPEARLCFMGEAPGADEDRQGEPFVGRAGQLLNKIIQACGMRREDVYILNVLKCRPPGNRNPKPEEAANCSGYLNRQLELVNPEFICCLGAVAAQNLLQTPTAIGRLRGTVHEYRGIKVVCTYHPAYLLRNPAAKKDAWDDMQMLMRLMGVGP